MFEKILLQNYPIAVTYRVLRESPVSSWRVIRNTLTLVPAAPAVCSCLCGCCPVETGRWDCWSGSPGSYHSPPPSDPSTGRSPDQRHEHYIPIYWLWGQQQVYCPNTQTIRNWDSKLDIVRIASIWARKT